MLGIPEKYWELAKLEAHLIQRLGEMPRTKLVKLVYLIDERYYRLHGRTLTGMGYIYDDHGPNAVDNQIVKVGDLLDNRELVIEQHSTWSGSPQFNYKPGPAPRFDPTFPPDATDTIEEVVEECGAMSVKAIVEASKGTWPFRSNPNQGDALQMQTLKGNATSRLEQIRAAALKLSRPFDDGEIGYQEPLGGAADRAQGNNLRVG